MSNIMIGRWYEQGYNLLSGDELREPEEDIPKLVEVVMKSAPGPEGSTKDRMGAVWRDTEPAKITAMHDEGWMAQPQQPVIEG